MNEARRTYVGAYALCVKDAQLLLVRLGPSESESQAGKWTLPGGGLNWGEAPVDGVLRELTEETGLSGTVLGIAGIFSATYLRGPEHPRPPVHHLGIVYFVETLPGEIRNELDGSTDLCAWVPLADIARLPMVALAEYGCELVRGSGLDCPALLQR